MELDKHTGEIVQYNDLKTELLKRTGKEGKQDKQISSDEALKKSVEYLKQYAPSHLYNYAMVSEESIYETERGVYYFSFPRIENDILVSGDQISVSVSGDGSLLGLNVYRSDIKDWPSIEKIITKEKALEKYTEQLALDLNYTKVGAEKDNKHYHLVYSPKFTDIPFSFLNAKTGEWESFLDERNDRKVVSHPWAEKELNHLINTGILKVEDVKKFDPDAQITKGEAIEIIMKSLTWIYPDYYSGQRNKVQSFKNINPEHALHQVVERAVSQGILKKDKDNFDFDKPLTREELAVWYVRTLGLEQAAKNQGIYQLNFADAKDVSKENIGFVALAHSLDLLSASNNKFNPKQNVTYAQLAVSDVRLAHEVYSKGIEIRHY
ncbi:S-layer homology domain-containing protein [Bacillus sp. S/N-304-OC-R1]|uniref:S-layer homology domain-containing protein n=1 Tax=Bacillus sp. S/N-304-OC-R1 TaxID=2758034 RepID=UPI001C8DAF22|nr:S-layer homology domain-containing protein [Bacillus sp. S/N-304-OC-R1]MBY0121985.1 S-layer homology domain-containing protein [Bacillus sp. S/N-304-OC-R1]